MVPDLKPMVNPGMIFVHPTIQNEKVLQMERRTEVSILTG